MEDTQKEGPNLPPDKGKEWLETSLPSSDNDTDELFMGFPNNEMETDEQRTRKRRDKHTGNNETNNKQLKKPKQTQEQSESNNQQNQTLNLTITHNTNNLQSTSKQHTTKRTTENHNNKNTKDQSNQQNWVKNDQHNVVFIEPISIKEGEQLLEPMEVGKFLHEMELDQITELKRAGQYRYKLTYKRPKDQKNPKRNTNTKNQ